MYKRYAEACLFERALLYGNLAAYNSKCHTLGVLVLHTIRSAVAKCLRKKNCYISNRVFDKRSAIAESQCLGGSAGHFINSGFRIHIHTRSNDSEKSRKRSK